MGRSLIAAVIAVLAGLSGCGKKQGESSQVDFSITPGQPVVITADFTTHSGQVIKAPWFEFDGTVTNNSSDTVTIIALSLVVKVTNADGTTSTQTVNVSPSDFNYSLVCTSTVTESITFSDFGQFAPGESGPLKLTYRGTPLVSGCPSPDIAPVPIYIGNNPTSPNYNYSVQLQPEGWFGTVSDPSSRLDKIVYFSTQ